MQLLGIFLILLNVGAIAAPVAGVIMMHTDDLSQVIIPSNIEEIVTNTIGNEESIELPQYVCSSFDPETRSAQVTFSFTNTFEFDLVLNAVSAKIKCLDHLKKHHTKTPRHKESTSCKNVCGLTKFFLILQ